MRSDAPDRPDAIFSPFGMRLDGPGRSALLAWRGGWAFRVWNQDGRQRSRGLAVEDRMTARTVFRPATATQRLDAWWHARRNLVLIRTDLTDRDARDLVRLLVALRRFVETRPAAREALGDRDRVVGLVADLRTWPGPRPRPPALRGSEVREAEDALRFAGYQHGDDEPFPDWAPPDVEAVISAAMRRFRRDPAFDPDEYEPIVRRLAQAYVEAAPWPFGALIA